jgi:RNA-binding motif X-linked protein 2
MASGRASERELECGTKDEASWHGQYADSARIYVGGLGAGTSAKDLRAVFSQYGVVIDVQIPQNNDLDGSRRSNRGFAFITYADTRSAVLAVDNLNGIQLGDRRLRVDHSISSESRRAKSPERGDRSSRRTHFAEKLLGDDLNPRVRYRDRA